jgi:hypothetical protein
MKYLATLLSGDENAKNRAFAEGVHIAGDRYVAFKVEDRSVYLRSVCCIFTVWANDTPAFAHIVGMEG